MLMRTDPFRDFDRLAQQVFGTPGTWSRPTVMTGGKNDRKEISA